MNTFFESDIPSRIFAYHESKQDWMRPHLGASVIGKQCMREIWYGFRWVKKPNFTGRMLRLFETGQLAEDRLFSELKAIGIKVYGQQKEVKIISHFSGSVDGIGEGFSESKAPHLLEVKTANQKSFDDMVKLGVQKSKPQHFDQMTVYMGGLKLDRAYYFCINKNTDDIYAERIKFDKELYHSLVIKADFIIKNDTPPMRIQDNPARFDCKFCEYKMLCHSNDKPEVNCRTCIHSTPEPDGSWSCIQDGQKMVIDFDWQKEACEHHLFIPELLNREIAEAGKDFITYDNGWKNCRNSKEYMVC
jgi:hypothetical protein